MIKVMEAHCICCACPTTIVGTTEPGETVYARYRWGHLSVRIDPREDPPFEGAGGEWIFSEQIGEKFDGCLTYAKLRELTLGLIEWPDGIDL